jgi:ABC-type sugar transport system ATPase subunit
MARAGALVIFISHRMDEVMRLSDRISILRAGERVASLSRGEATSEELLKMMAPVARRSQAHA